MFFEFFSLNTIRMQLAMSNLHLTMNQDQISRLEYLD
ncbi:uncharacterized protein METZ01_LOCUS146622 [marine metagenome]|uniref:Uncharacterized protein n=1 Tax=marine metagenome TaxID=408172 RepID=A0A381ZWT7_9ZZZZ